MEEEGLRSRNPIAYLPDEKPEWRKIYTPNAECNWKNHHPNEAKGEVFSQSTATAAAAHSSTLVSYGPLSINSGGDIYSSGLCFLVYIC